jgi:hypothetical protein
MKKAKLNSALTVAAVVWVTVAAVVWVGILAVIPGEGIESSVSRGGDHG